jgi:hypothetical protein
LPILQTLSVICQQSLQGFQSNLEDIPTQTGENSSAPTQPAGPPFAYSQNIVLAKAGKADSAGLQERRAGGGPQEPACSPGNSEAAGKPSKCSHGRNETGAKPWEINMTVKTNSQTPATNRTDESRPLDDGALDRVGGGITVTKRTDASSADLFLKCANGKHYN